MFGRGLLLGASVAIAFAVSAAPASATVEIHSHNDPAGDPTAITYRIQIPSQAAPIDFSLHDGEYKGFGPFQGVVVVQALVPAGWQVADIQCTGPNPAEFTIDVPNGRVTMTHGVSEDQICSFTNRNGPAPGGGSSGVAPAPSQPQSGQPLPVGPALLGVKSGRGYAAATVRVTRRSVIKTQLLRKKRVVGTSRVVRKAGVYDVTVSIDPKLRRSWRHEGRKRIQLTLKLVVAPIKGLTRVYRYRVLVRL